MAITLKPIKPKRISDQVFDQLRELIYRGDLQPGKQLMPERELAEVMGVSRTSVRDAINKLVAMGLVEQKQGQGTFVRSTESDGNNLVAVAVETQNATLLDLLEVRMGLECNAAAMAARKATEKDIRILKKNLEDMENEIASGRKGTAADVSFHMAISYATKNPLQVYLMKNFFDFLFQGIRENLSHLYEHPNNIEKILSQHSNIYHAIKKHDPESAYYSMRRHINFVIQFFQSRNENSLFK